MNTRLRVTVAEATIRESRRGTSFVNVRYEVVGQPNFEALYEMFSLEHEHTINALIELATSSGWRRGSTVRVSAEAIASWLDTHGRSHSTLPVELTFTETDYAGMRRLACRGPHVAVPDE